MKFQNWYGYDETAFPFATRQRNFEEAAKRIRARINARAKEQQEEKITHIDD